MRMALLNFSQHKFTFKKSGRACEYHKQFLCLVFAFLEVDKESYDFNDR